MRGRLQTQVAPEPQAVAERRAHERTALRLRVAVDALEAIRDTDGDFAVDIARQTLDELGLTNR